jgi:putative glutamine amidotransferase
MRRPIVLLPACTRDIGSHPYYAVQTKYVDAVVRGAGCAPLIVPALGDALELETMLGACDGIMLTGSSSNVHPSRWRWCRQRLPPARRCSASAAACRK